MCSIFPDHRVRCFFRRLGTTLSSCCGSVTLLQSTGLMHIFSHQYTLMRATEGVTHTHTQTHTNTHTHTHTHTDGRTHTHTQAVNYNACDSEGLPESMRCETDSLEHFPSSEHSPAFACSAYLLKTKSPLYAYICVLILLYVS